MAEPIITSGTLADLVEDTANPRVHTARNIATIATSLQEVGAMRSLVVNEDNQILAGNGAFQAASEVGLERVVFIDTDGDALIVHRRHGLSPDQQLRYKIADNAATDQSSFDSAYISAVAEQDRRLLEGILSEHEIRDAQHEAKKTRDPEARGKAMAARALAQERWGVQAGDLYTVHDPRSPELQHRLLCGDSTDPAAVARLCAGITVTLCITSPPYNVGKDYEWDRSLADWRTLVQAVLANVAAHVPAAFINLADIHVGPDHREVHTYGDLLAICANVGWPLIATRIWHKPPAWAQGPYHLSSYRPADEFEYLGLFGTLPHKARLDTEWRYRGVWEFPSVPANAKHPAMFPLELPSRALILLTDPGAAVIDPFLGSGTTVQAAADLGRVGLGLELDPVYLAVALSGLADAGLDIRKEGDS